MSADFQPDAAKWLHGGIKKAININSPFPPAGALRLVQCVRVCTAVPGAALLTLSDSQYCVDCFPTAYCLEALQREEGDIANLLGATLEFSAGSVRSHWVHQPQGSPLRLEVCLQATRLDVRAGRGNDMIGTPKRINEDGFFMNKLKDFAVKPQLLAARAPLLPNAELRLWKSLKVEGMLLVGGEALRARAQVPQAASASHRAFFQGKGVPCPASLGPAPPAPVTEPAGTGKRRREEPAQPEAGSGDAGAVRGSRGEGGGGAAAYLVPPLRPRLHLSWGVAFGEWRSTLGLPRFL